MKQLLLLTTIFFALNLSAQNISGTDISKDSSIQYLEVTVTYSAKLFKVKIEVYANYGQEAGDADKGLILDSNGSPRAFISRPELLNYLYQSGWKVHSTYPVPHPNAFVTCYLMERRK